MKRQTPLPACVKPAEHGNCPYYFDGGCGAVPYYPDDYTGKKMKFSCLFGVKNENILKKKKLLEFA